MNIFVSNINFSTQEESFQNLFSAYGEITSARIITDRETGRSRGFGFVEMPNEEEGQAAIDAINGTEFEGKTLNVGVARPREERPRRESYSSRGGYSNDRGGYGNRGGGYNDRGGYGNRGGGYGNRGGGYNRGGFNGRDNYNTRERYSVNEDYSNEDRY
ncbi:MAG: RNA-binding protein [Prevotella sp.]|nr:RNA-binding protein [Prevotella sp.]